MSSNRTSSRGRPGGLGGSPAGRPCSPRCARSGAAGSGVDVPYARRKCPTSLHIDGTVRSGDRCAITNRASGKTRRMSSSLDAVAGRLQEPRPVGGGEALPLQVLHDVAEELELDAHRLLGEPPAIGRHLGVAQEGGGDEAPSASGPSSSGSIASKAWPSLAWGERSSNQRQKASASAIRSSVGSFGSPPIDAQLKACQKVRKLKSPGRRQDLLRLGGARSRRAHDDDRALDRLLRDLRVAPDIALHPEAVHEQAQELALEGPGALGVQLRPSPCPARDGGPSGARRPPRRRCRPPRSPGTPP